MMSIKIFLTRYRFKLALLSILLPAAVMLVSCTVFEEANRQEPQAKKETALNQNVLMLLFQESEPGIDPYTTRMLVSKGYLRMDDGEDEGDFTLFDRKKKTIYSVTHENQRIFLILNRPMKMTWVNEFTLEEKTSEDAQAPEISGKKSRQVEFFVNGKSCKRIAVVPELLDQALDAIKEFRQVLASEHIRNLDRTPVEMQDPCFLSLEVRYPGRVLQAGFPIQERDYTGRMRALLDYDSEFSVNLALFRLPQGYQQFSPPMN